jgi:hypothetical protein
MYIFFQPSRYYLPKLGQFFYERQRIKKKAAPGWPSPLYLEERRHVEGLPGLQEVLPRELPAPD